MSKKDKTEDVAEIDFKVDTDVIAEAESQLNGVQVTNNWRGPLDICGTVILSGETVQVPDFDPKQPLVAGFLQAKVISADA